MERLGLHKVASRQKGGKACAVHGGPIKSEGRAVEERLQTLSARVHGMEAELCSLHRGFVVFAEEVNHTMAELASAVEQLASNRRDKENLDA